MNAVLEPGERVLPARRLREAAMRDGGGIYIYRTRKPMSVFGLMPVAWWMPPAAAALAIAGLLLTGGPWWFGLALLFTSGRHFAYVGETVSFEKRHSEHMRGGGRWKHAAQPWSDLDAKCVFRLRLPKWKWLLRSTETLLILILQPAYNEKKNLLNLRRIPRATARRQRQARNKRHGKISWNFRSAHLLVIVALAVYAHIAGVL